MTSSGSGSLHPKEHEAVWTSTIASLMVGVACFSLWFWLLPGWLGFQVQAAQRAVAMDCGGAVGAGICGGVALRLGFWTNGARDTGTNRSAEETGGGGILPICAESDVHGIFLRVDWIMGDVRMVELGGDWRGRAGDFGSHGVCAAVRRAEPAEIVWRGIWGVLPECAAVVTEGDGLGEIGRLRGFGWQILDCGKAFRDSRAQSTNCVIPGLRAVVVRA
jgi:hypothetical protein